MASESASIATTLVEPTFHFPWEYSLPPFFTTQPNPTTRKAQLQGWSALIQAYCRHTRTTSLILSDETLASPLFFNRRIDKRLKHEDAKAVLEWMASVEGEKRAEWKKDGTLGKVRGSEEVEGECWIYWRTVEEWAGLIATWVEETGQKGSVLTLFELTQGNATRSTEFHDLDPELLQKSLNVLVKKGKAQIFGNEDQQGVKFF